MLLYSLLLLLLLMSGFPATSFHIYSLLLLLSFDTNNNNNIRVGAGNLFNPRIQAFNTSGMVAGALQSNSHYAICLPDLSSSIHRCHIYLYPFLQYVKLNFLYNLFPLDPRSDD